MEKDFNNSYDIMRHLERRKKNVIWQNILVINQFFIFFRGNLFTTLLPMYYIARIQYDIHAKYCRYSN
jgi:hypothetical protein